MNYSDKLEVMEAVVAALRAELEGYRRAARAAQAAATDPDSKAENKYDTRTLEASYLARGVAFRVAETEAALGVWESMAPRDFSAMLPVASGALVELENATGRSLFLVGPAGGGITVTGAEGEVTVVTEESPLGRELSGRMEGHIFLLESGGRRIETVLASVC